MPDPLSPLYEELSLTDGQQEGRRRDNIRRHLCDGRPGDPPRWRDMMDGIHYITVNGFAYQRLEFKMGRPKEEVAASYEAYKASAGWSPELDARLEGVRRTILAEAWAALLGRSQQNDRAGR